MHDPTLTRPADATTAPPPDGVSVSVHPVVPPGYDLDEEVGRGGMGVVYRARDLELNREVAVKLLQERYPAGSPTATRFVEEAQITSQLQHPGIPPVYRVGTCADGRPFLAMKLIKGQTLDVQLKADGPSSTRWLGVFEAVCQAVGYAHAHDVIHRDLKPANVMVGAFGEVQVMDWGLAKVLASRERERPEQLGDPEATTAPTLIRTTRDSDGSHTQAGSVLGTPAYMAPEQAASETAKIGPPSDVFGLGAILCALLTGRPPFEGTDAESVRINAMRGKTGEALTRLDGCGADPDLVALCKRCLAVEPEDRPATGDEVAAAVAQLRRAADERAKQAEQDKLAAEVRATEQAKRRKAIQWAATAVVSVLILGTLATLYGLNVANTARTEAEFAFKMADTQRIEAEKAQAAEADEKAKAVAAQKAESNERQKAEAAEKIAVAERKKADAALLRADGLRLAAEATAVVPTDPALALLLSAEGVRRHPHHLTFAAFHAAAGSLREERTIEAGEPVAFAKYSPDGRRVLIARVGDSNTRPRITIHDAQTGKQLAGWLGFGQAVADAEWSPDGRRVAVAVEGFAYVRFTDKKPPEAALFTDRTAYVFDAATGKDVLHLRGQHKQRVISVRFSPDGSRLLTASWDATARLWNVETGEQIHVLEGHQRSLRGAIFSPDGSRILTVGSLSNSESDLHKGWLEPAAKGEQPVALDPGPLDRPLKLARFLGRSTGSIGGSSEAKLARVWDATTGKQVAALTKAKPGALVFGTNWDVTSWAFSPDGKQVTMAFQKGGAAVWDATEGGDEKNNLDWHEGTVTHVAFSRDGKWLATAGADGTVNLRSRDLTESKGFSGQHSSRLTVLDFSADGNLLTASEDKTAVLHAVESGVDAYCIGHSGPVRSASISPDGSHILTAGDTTVRLWRTGPVPDVARVIRAHTRPLTALSYSPDGAKLLTASEDENARVHDPATGRELLVLGIGRQLGIVNVARFSPDGRSIVTASATTHGTFNRKLVNESSVHVWNAESGAEVFQLREHKTAASFAAFTPDGKRVLTVSNGATRAVGGPLSGTNSSSAEAGFVRAWDVPSQRLLFTAPEQVAERCPPAFSQDGRFLLTLPQGAPATLLNGTDGRLIRIYQDAGERLPITVALSGDGRRVVLVGRSETMLLNAETGEPVAKLDDGLGGWMNKDVVRFSPDSRLLLTAHDRTATVWDATTGKRLATLTGHENFIFTAEFSHDGKLIVTGSADATAAVWAAETGALVTVYMSHPGVVKFVAFSPKGDQVATGSTDGVVRVWSLDPVADGLKRAPRKLTAPERMRYELPE